MRDREFVPGHPGDVTAAWLARAMRAGNVPGAAHVARVDAEVIGEDRGFTGVVARLTPRYREPVSGAPRTLIGKFPLAERADESTYRQAQGASTELLRRFAERAAREVEFFRFAGSELTQVPVCYFGHADVDAGEVLLLLEDLSAGVPGDALAGCSVEQARSVVNGIQTVHARWWNDDTLASLAWLPGWAGSNADRVERFRDRVETVIERYSDRLSGDIVGLLRGSAAQLDRILDDLSAAPATLAHLDLHLDNVIFMPSRGAPDARIIDWQSVGRGPAMLDVAGFIVEALEVEDRRDNEIALLREYHDGLWRVGVRDYSFEQLFDDYLRALLVRLAGNIGWLARVEIDDLEGREHDLVEAILEPGRLFAALLNHEVDRRFGLR